MADEAHLTALRFAAGDSAAALEVRSRVQRILAFRGYRIPLEDRVDLEQSIMLQLWQAVGREDFEATAFWGFIEVVTSRRCIDWYRTRKPDRVLQFPTSEVDPGPGPLGDTLGREKVDLARRALAELPPACRELVDLHYRRQKTYAEMAEMLGRSEGSLRVQMHRCIQRASRALAGVTQGGSRGGTEPKV